MPSDTLRGGRMSTRRIQYTLPCGDRLVKASRLLYNIAQRCEFDTILPASDASRRQANEVCMTWTELALTAIGLSMDAFAVAMCKGLSMQRLNGRRAVVIGLFFGGFQALMPLLGWLLGTQFAHLIESVDHWVVFALLAFIGVRMILDALRGGDEAACDDGGELNLRELTMLALATSIDALAVGISFAFLNVRIVPSVLAIGAITFLLSVAGVAIGCRFGAKYRVKATLLGGVILLLIGVKILLEHLGVLA